MDFRPVICPELAETMRIICKKSSCMAGGLEGGAGQSWDCDRR